MNANFALVRRATLGLTLAAAWVLAGCASGPPATSPDVLQRIEAASTRADHESLAVYYVQEAAKAREAAETHRRMAARYGNFTSAGNRGGGYPMSNMKSHCNAIVQSNESIATSYDAMAASHREMAAQARP